MNTSHADDIIALAERIREKQSDVACYERHIADENEKIIDIERQRDHWQRMRNDAEKGLVDALEEITEYFEKERGK